jgi:hypothetical protein
MGGETTNDLMMGGQGLVVRKWSRLDSPIARGKKAQELFKMKLQANEAARALGPEAQAMVPKIYGQGTKTLKDGTTLYYMDQAYEHGLTPVPKHEQASAVRKVLSTVIQPLREKGIDLLDVVDGKKLREGNVMKTPSGQLKIIDSVPVIDGKSPAFRQRMGDWFFSPPEILDKLPEDARRPTMFEQAGNISKDVEESLAGKKGLLKKRLLLGGLALGIPAAIYGMHKYLKDKDEASRVQA